LKLFVVAWKGPITVLDPVTTKEPVISNPLGNVIYPSKYDAVAALLAQLLVPKNPAEAVILPMAEVEPVILRTVPLPDTNNDPVMTAEPL
jgi:hypothetical protein